MRVCPPRLAPLSMAPRLAPLSMALRPTPLDVVGAAALVTGTAIGGGFLALPYTTAPSGAVPSSVVLLGIWVWMLAESFIVSDLVIDAASESPNSDAAISFPSIGRDAFGELGASAISATFVVLMMTTLVAQFAKGGLLLAPWLGPLPPAARCVLLAAGCGLVARLSPLGPLGALNTALTAGFVLATASLFAKGWPLAVWSRLGRADWSSWWQGAPSLLQLHVYLEVVPSICASLRHDRRAVRLALLLGSSALLGLQLAWSSLGLALVPYVGSGLRSDPVDALLGAGGGIGGATAAVAACAIATTVLGTCIALRDFFSDAFRRRPPAGGQGAPEKAATGGGGDDGAPSSAGLGSDGLPAAVAYALALAVPAIAAGTSRDAFFGAIDLAGAYPVALLWGLAPPLMALRRRWRGARRQPQEGAPGSTAGLLGLCALSAGFVGASLVGDVGSLLAGGAARWQ